MLAYGCGFSSQAHFARRFKDRYAMNPREYRHAHRRDVQSVASAFRLSSSLAEGLRVSASDGCRSAIELPAESRRTAMRPSRTLSHLLRHPRSGRLTVSACASQLRRFEAADGSGRNGRPPPNRSHWSKIPRWAAITSWDASMTGSAPSRMKGSQSHELDSATQRGVPRPSHRQPYRRDQKVKGAEGGVRRDVRNPRDRRAIRLHNEVGARQR